MIAALTLLETRRSVATPLGFAADGTPRLPDLRADGAEILAVPDALGVVGETLVGPMRLGRPTPKVETKIEVLECTICDHAPSVDNGRPFGPLLHKVIVASEHKVSLDSLLPRDFVEIYDEWRAIAETGCARFPGLDGVTYGMNFGEYIRSGATQAHLHAQVTGVERNSYNAGDALGTICRAWSVTNEEDGKRRSYLEDYLAALRHAKLVLVENESAALYVPISQRFIRELQIIVKRPGIGNVLATDASIRRDLAELEWVAHRAHDRQGLTSFNTVAYATRFSDPNEHDQRLVLCICPRSSVIAFSELLHRSVVDELPSTCAEVMRESIADLGQRKARL